MSGFFSARKGKTWDNLEFVIHDWPENLYPRGTEGRGERERERRRERRRNWSEKRRVTLFPFSFPFSSYILGSFPSLHKGFVTREEQTTHSSFLKPPTLNFASEYVLLQGGIFKSNSLGNHLPAFQIHHHQSHHLLFLFLLFSLLFWSFLGMVSLKTCWDWVIEIGQTSGLGLFTPIQSHLIPTLSPSPSFPFSTDIPFY